MVPPLGLAPPSSRDQHQQQQQQQHRSQSVSKATTAAAATAAAPSVSFSSSRDAPPQRKSTAKRAVSTSHAERYPHYHPHTQPPSSSDYPPYQQYQNHNHPTGILRASAHKPTTTTAAAVAPAVAAEVNSGVEPTRGLRRRPPTDIPTTIFQYHSMPDRDDDTVTTINDQHDNHNMNNTSSTGHGNDTDDMENPEQMARAILTLRQTREEHHHQRTIHNNIASATTTTTTTGSHRRSSHGTDGRYQSRSSIRGPQRETPELYHSSRNASSKYLNNNHLHRSVSAPRPQAAGLVTNSNNNNNNNIGPAANHHQFHTTPPNNIKTSGSSSTKKQVQQRTTVSNYGAPLQSSPEEQRASACLQKAEVKVNGLMQELDDLRFLEEIDLQDTPDATNTNMPLVAAPAAAAGRMRRSLPLPPPTPLDTPPPPPSMVQLLSPRSISKMDRMALELETQTLCRTVDMINKEKGTLEKAVTMYELSLQDHERHEREFHKEREQQKQLLEHDVRAVKQQLAQAKHELALVRTQIATEYYDRMADNVTKLQRTQQAADQFQSERDTCQTAYDALVRETEEQQSKWKKDEARTRKMQLAKEAELDLQVQQVSDLADDLREQLEREKAVVRELGTKLGDEIATRDGTIQSLNDRVQKQTAATAAMQKAKDESTTQLLAKDRELLDLRTTLRQSEQTIRTIQRTKDEAYEVQVSSLQEQLALHKDQCRNAVLAKDEQAMQLQELERQIRESQTKCSEQAELVQDMTSRLDAVHKEYREKFAELKQAYESKEKRRLEEMVQVHAKEVDEYERRLTVTKEQLLHQNDRHTAEIAQKTQDAERSQELHATVQRELKANHTAAVYLLEEKLSQTRLDFEQADADREKLRLDLESYPSKEETLKLLKEREFQDKDRENETNRLREQSDRLARDVVEKETKLQSLVGKLRDAEVAHATNLTQIKNEHSTAMLRCEETFALQINTHRSNETALQLKLERMQTEHGEIQTSLAAQILELKRELDKTKKEFDVVQQIHDESDAQVRSEMSVLEGKRRAAVAALQLKTDTIDDLQEKFNFLSTSSVETAEAYSKEVSQLQREINESKKQAATDRTDMAATLEISQHELQQRCDLIRKLEFMATNASTHESVLENRIKEIESVFREAKAELISERTRHESVEDQSRADMARLQGKFLANEASLKEKRETIGELEDKLRSIADQSSSTNKEMQKEVEQLRNDVRNLEDLVDQYRADIFEKDGLLKQQKSKLRQNSEDAVSMQNSVAKTEEKQAKIVHHLQASLDAVKSELESELVNQERSEARLQQRLASFEADLQDGEAKLKEKSATIDSLEKSLKQNADESTASVLSLQSTIDTLRNDMTAVNRLLEVERQKVADRTFECKELERQHSVLQEQIGRLQKLEGALDERGEIALREELISLRRLYETSQQVLDAEKTTRRDIEIQMRATTSELEESIRSKNGMMEDLTDGLKLARDDSARTVKSLKGEVESLELDLAVANDALKRERNALEASLGKYEEMKETNCSLRRTVSNLQQAMSDFENEKTNKSIEGRIVELLEINQLEAKFESERLSNESLTLRVGELEADLEIKVRQLARLPALQTQLKQLVDGREELQAQFERIEAELEVKDKQLIAKSIRSQDSTTDLQAALDQSKKSHDALEVKLKEMEFELVSQKREASHKYDELKAKLEHTDKERKAKQQSLDTDIRLNSSKSEKAKQALESQIRILEEDRADRETQVKATSERYSNQIIELQMKVEELSRTKIALTSRLSRLDADLEHRDELMNMTSHQLSNDVCALQTQLAERLAENEALKIKLEATEAKLDESETAQVIQAKLDVEAKEKRSLLSRLGDVEAELERKEKQIRDVVDRYTRDISELQCKLEDELRSTSSLQKDIDKLMRGETSISASAVARLAKEQVEKALLLQQRETASLQIELDEMRSARKSDSKTSADDRIAKLTKTVVELNDALGRLRVTADEREKHLEEQLVQAMGFSGDTSRDVTDLEDKLFAIERSKLDLEERFKKVQGERTEVMTALGDLIGEVQSRDDEIEALATILKKREEELEHAKLIATKALSSAQDLKARCRSLEGRRQTDVSGEITELNSSVEYLSKTNESLERKTTRINMALHEREMECKELRERLKRIHKGAPHRTELVEEKKQDDDGFQSLEGGFPTFETTSPTTRASSIVVNDSMSTQSEEVQGTTGWLHDFSSQSVDSNDETASFAESRSKASSTQSKKPSEKDSYLRKYIRSKYTKQKGTM